MNSGISRTSGALVLNGRTPIPGYVAQLVRAVGSYPSGQWFESTRSHSERGGFGLEDRLFLFQYNLRKGERG